MTLKKRLILIVGLVVATIVSASAQNFNGIATYQSARKMDENGFQIKGEGITPEMQKALMERMKKQFQKEYELKFNLTESTWKEAESLGDGPTHANAGGAVIVMSAGGGGVTYKNTAENKFLQETNVFGKPFLLDDELEQREWQMTTETKKIGNYTAYKAVFTDIRESRSISIGRVNDEEEQGETQVRMDTTTIEAWYTPDIPVSQGPDTHWGLPGLIMEITDGSMSYVCTKVVLNPEDGVQIKAPKKGKRVNREELRAEIEAKAAEMGQKFKSGGKGGASFRIGGQ